MASPADSLVVISLCFPRFNAVMTAKAFHQPLHHKLHEYDRVFRNLVRRDSLGGDVLHHR